MGNDSAEITEMHDNPLHGLDEEHGQVGEKDKEEYAFENVTASESHVRSISGDDDGDDDDDDDGDDNVVGTEMGHLYRDSTIDVVPMQLNPTLDPVDMAKYGGNTEREHGTRKKQHECVV